MPTLDQELDYYIKNQREIVEKYRGMVVVIHGQAVHGAYPDELTAVREAKKSFKPGDFLVQKVEPGSESFTQTFYSRASFS
jgi:hypothetical protein